MDTSVASTSSAADDANASFGEAIDSTVKEAKAQLKQAIWSGGKPVINTIGTSADEFTFFDLTGVDLDGDGAPEIIARGNKRVSLFRFDGKRWQRRGLTEVKPVLNTAIGKTKAGWKIAVPDRRQTRIIAVSSN